MSITFKHAYATLTENSSKAFTYLKETYGSNIHMGTHKDKPLQLIGTLGAFQRMVMFANSEANNAMGDVERLAYQELKRKLLRGIDVYNS